MTPRTMHAHILFCAYDSPFTGRHMASEIVLLTYLLDLDMICGTISYTTISLIFQIILYNTDIFLIALVADQLGSSLLTGMVNGSHGCCIILLFVDTCKTIEGSVAAFFAQVLSVFILHAAGSPNSCFSGNQLSLIHDPYMLALAIYAIVIITNGVEAVFRCNLALLLA